MLQGVAVDFHHIPAIGVFQACRNPVCHALLVCASSEAVCGGIRPHSVVHN